VCTLCCVDVPYIREVHEVAAYTYVPSPAHARSTEAGLSAAPGIAERRGNRHHHQHHHHFHLHHHHHHHHRGQSSPCMRGLFSPSVGVGQQPRADDDDAVHRRDSAGSTCVSRLCSPSLSLSPAPSLPLLLFLSVSLSLYLSVCLSLDRCHQQEKTHRRVAPLRHVA